MNELKFENLSQTLQQKSGAEVIFEYFCDRLKRRDIRVNRVKRCAETPGNKRGQENAAAIFTAKISADAVPTFIGRLQPINPFSDRTGVRDRPTHTDRQSAPVKITHIRTTADFTAAR